MEKFKKIVYHRVGTNANAYIKRLFKYYEPNNEIEFFELEKGEFEVLQNNKRVDFFKSNSTKNQFINTLLAMGILIEKPGSYLYKSKYFNLEEVTKKIFEYSNNKAINILRQSRIISFLVLINFINDENIKNFNIFTKRKKELITETKKLKSEVSIWEKEILKNIKNIKDILGRIEDYEFTKK